MSKTNKPMLAAVSLAAAAAVSNAVAEDLEPDETLEPGAADQETDVPAIDAAATDAPDDPDTSAEVAGSETDRSAVLTASQRASDLASGDSSGAYIGGVEAERARISAILGDVLPGHEQMAISAAIETPLDHGEFLQAQTRAEREVRAGRITNLADDEKQVSGLRSVHGTPANGPSPEKDTDKHAGLQGEDLWTAQYDDDKALQAEFASKGNYLAYMRRQSAA